MPNATPAPAHRPENPVAVLLDFLLEGFRDFVPNLIRMLRHPWTFLDGTRARRPGLLRQALAFFVFAQGAQRVLWFFSMLPELPYTFASPNLRMTAIFLDLMGMGLLWHLLLRRVTRRAVPLTGTMAILLYNTGMAAVLIVPVLVFAKLAGSLLAGWLGDDPAVGFVLFLLVFVVFCLLILSRWMAALHEVRKGVSLMTMMLSEGIWLALRTYVLIPFVLQPAFRLALAAYEIIVRFLVKVLF